MATLVQAQAALGIGANQVLSARQQKEILAIQHLTSLIGSWRCSLDYATWAMEQQNTGDVNKLMNVFLLQYYEIQQTVMSLFGPNQGHDVSG